MNKARPNSPSGFTLVEIMVVVVVIGLLASMAIPAFKKIRESSQDKAVFNNARQLSSGSDQYFLESGCSTVGISMLVGPTNYVKALNTVAGETYPATYQHGVAITVTGVASLRTITFAP
jgi:type IV pilus assembly protein PilA